MPSGPSHFGGRNITTVFYQKRFAKDLAKYEKKDQQLHADIIQAIEDLSKNPRPGYLRFEKLRSTDNIYTVHIRGNVKMPMELDAEHATLRRVAHHDTIDTSP